MADKGSKTEKPTAKRLKDARAEGRIPRSPEVVAWGGLLVGTYVFPMVLSADVSRIKELLATVAVVMARPTEAGALRLLVQGFWAAALMAAPLAIGMMLFSVVLNLAQVGLSVSSKRLKPKLSRLNPLQGFKRLFSSATVWEAAKQVMKLAVLAGMVTQAVTAITRRMVGAGHLSVPAATAMISADALRLLRNVAAVGLVIAAIDYAMQRRRIMRDLMMSVSEVKQEHRQNEGDPHVRGAIRSRQMAMSRNRMISAVATADVIVVNPTHVAVALAYDPERGAPRVVAKGADHLAAKIRERAEEHGVPLVRDVALARTLYKACEIGHEIPPALYDAVARLLAFIFTLRRQGMVQGFHTLAQPLLPESEAIAAGV